MEEKSVLMLQAIGGKTQSVSHALTDCISVPPAAAMRYTKGSQRESRRCNACHDAGIGPASQAAVLGQPSVRMCLFPEVPEAGSFDLFEKSILITAESIS